MPEIVVYIFGLMYLWYRSYNCMLVRSRVLGLGNAACYDTMYRWRKVITVVL